MHLTSAFQKSIEKGVTGLNVAQIDFKATFRMPKSALISTFFWFPVSRACLLWVAAIFSDKRSTRLLPKPLLMLKCTTLLNLSGILCCELVNWLTWSILNGSHASNHCLKKVGVSESFWCWTSQKRYITYESMKTWRRKWCSWDGAAMAMVKVRVFLLGVLFVFKHLDCSGKERLGGSSPFQASSCSLQMRGGILFYIGLFWSWTTPPGHTLSGIRNFREVWAQAAFFWLKRGHFPDLFVSSEGSSVGINTTGTK